MSEENEVLDLNDPRYDEAYEGDPQADYNAFVVVPDGVHTVRLEYQEDKTAYGKPYHDKEGNEKTMVIAPLNVVVQEEGKPYNGSKTKDWATSLISFRSGTSTIGDICRLAKQAHAPGISMKGLKEKIDTVIIGEPLLRAKYQWEGQCETCRKSYIEKNPEGLGGAALKKASNAFANKASLKGMLNWPSDGKDGYASETVCPDCGESIQARPVIRKYLALQ